MTHWDKLKLLIEMAKSNPEVATTLREGPPSKVIALLRSEKVGFTMEELEMLYSDVEYLSGPQPAAFWRW